MPNQPQTPIQRINAVLNHRPVFPIPRGELWLGRQVLHRAGLADTVEGHFRLAEQLGHDMVCLPVAHKSGHVPDLGYRYFEVADLSRGTRPDDRVVAAVVDGPFQSLVNRKGLMAVLKTWVSQRQELLDAYAAKQLETLDLMERCLALDIRVVMVADDLAADRGTLMSPGDIELLCESFYRHASRTVHAAGGVVFVHSCGKIDQLALLLKGWGIDGLAAVQHRINDLVALRQVWDGRFAIMGGIDAELLASDPPPSSALASMVRLIASLAPEGGLIIGSTCGLYRGEFLPRIKRLYAHADHVLE